MTEDFMSVQFHLPEPPSEGFVIQADALALALSTPRCEINTKSFRGEYLLVHRFGATTRRKDLMLDGGCIGPGGGFVPAMIFDHALGGKVTIPRQSRGHSNVSRSKRQFRLANAAPHSWSHQFGGGSSP